MNLLSFDLMSLVDCIWMHENNSKKDSFSFLHKNMVCHHLKTSFDVSINKSLLISIIFTSSAHFYTWDGRRIQVALICSPKSAMWRGSFWLCCQFPTYAYCKPLIFTKMTFLCSMQQTIVSSSSEHPYMQLVTDLCVRCWLCQLAFCTVLRVDILTFFKSFVLNSTLYCVSCMTL